MKQIYCESVSQWRNWLQRNHGTEREVWLLFCKKDARKQSLDYGQALDEALCFGWIDSIIKRIDDRSYARKFTPRKERSKWSQANKSRIVQLIKNSRMTEAGYAIIEAAKANGCWNKPDRPRMTVRMPKEFQQALMKKRTALENFGQLALSYRKQYIIWIAMAKRPETKEKRIAEAIGLLEKGQKLGLR